MKNLVLMLSLAFLAAGCIALTDGTSTRVMIEPKPPAGIPQRVAVLPFRGSPPINYDVTERFANGLPALGFDLIRSVATNKIVATWDMEPWELDPAVRRLVAETTGAQAVFLGLLEQELGRFSMSSRLQVRLFDVLSGKLLWSAQVSSQQAAMQMGNMFVLAQLNADEALARLRTDMLGLPDRDQASVTDKK